MGRTILLGALAGALAACGGATRYSIAGGGAAPGADTQIDIARTDEGFRLIVTAEPWPVLDRPRREPRARLGVVDRPEPLERRRRDAIARLRGKRAVRRAPP